jgi:C4-dicarboxylate transporter/malic acid transport protein
MKTQEEKTTKNEKASWLQYFPIMFYTVVMGLCGLALAYERLNLLFDISGAVFEILRGAASLVYALICVFYAAKLIKHPQACKTELFHPVQVNFFAAFSIGTLLVATLWRDFAPVYDALFCVGVAFQTFITLHAMSFWIHSDVEPQHASPAWFLPIVGNLFVPLAAPAASELAWYYFAIGIFFWPVLFAVLFYRIIFHDQMPQKFIPTLFIVIAPPAMAFLDYVKLTGGFDEAAKIMLYVTLFFALLILFMFKSFLRLKFFLSWWAFTFPTAAASIAFLRAFEFNGIKFFLFAGAAGFAILCVFIGIVGFYTVKAIFSGEIFTAQK